ncbi:hypothetical protein FRC02_007636 [Tulasnella sp. 418]|nr:hypothetical protein FRC02_007636 [Tulasnella sp. 418]
MPSYVVTGGRGIGYEFINQLSRNSDNIVISLVRKLSNVPQVQSLVAERKNLFALEADIVDLPALKRAAEEVSKITGGTLDVLINNAALVDSAQQGWMHPLDYYSEKGDPQTIVHDLKEAFDVNVVGPILTTNAFLPLLRAGSTKKVITLSSGMGDLDFILPAEQDLSPAYAISKAAVNMAVAKFAVSLKDEGFIFLAISPGLVDTAGDSSDIPDEVRNAYAKMLKGFQKVAPHFEGKPSSPEESVTSMLAIIDTLKPEENGAFISHLRNRNWL